MSNFLDACCPKCGDASQLDIAATLWVRLTENGTDPKTAHNPDYEYTRKSLCRCGGCGHSERLSAFEDAGG